MRKVQRIRFQFVCLFFLFFASVDLWAYKEVIHQEISDKAINRSDSKLAENDWLKSSLGFQFEFNRGNKINFNKGETLIDLIRQGASDEDEDTRAINHFYDPYHDKGFDLLVYSAKEIHGVASPDWLFENNLNIASFDNDQDNSYLDALEYFEEALVSQGEQQRRVAWRNLFLSLGHIVHHMQDMAQPQHVRNDSHLDKYPFLVGVYNPSLYEIFTREWGGFDEEGNKVREDKLYYGNYEVNHEDFPTARDFWKNESQTGIAEFTNKNFFSDGTIYTGSEATIETYPSPTLYHSTASKIETDIKDLCASYPDLCSEESMQLTGKVTFLGTTVSDTYSGETFNNPWSVTYSIFDKDLEEEGILFDGYIYALNSFNYVMAQSILIPRATAYSTAMLNHFFRGSIEISLPDEGVYALIDHATENVKDVSGFHTINMKIRNTTSTGEDTSPAGFWVAIARFHRNNCYQANLSGEYGSPGMNWESCRSPEEEVLVSTALLLPALDKDDEPRTVEFSFDKAIPINASDVYLQVMYRGPLGQEDDAVMVATKDISEPTFIGLYNTLDQWKFSGRSFSEYFCRDENGVEIPYQDCRTSHWVSEYYRFSAPGAFASSKPSVSEFAPLISIPQIPLGSYGRLAMLTDIDSYTAFSLVEYWNDTSMYYPDNVVSVIQNQYDVLSESLEPIKYFEFRGVYIDERYINNVADGDYEGELADFSPLMPLPSVIYPAL